MTRLHNDPAQFAEEAASGFVTAHHRRVRAVTGGVVRRSRTPGGQVSVVIGGGSGHYPAFGGLVGQGLAAGAVLGNVFASPSTSQVVSVAKAADRGGGVLLVYGNYAGDLLNFTAAQERLRAAGVECESLQVTDDISSAPATERARRRGVAGDLLVFKVAGAAAAEGRSLAEVADAARAANERTRTLGVGFSGCTLPGAAKPLFTVPDGTMAVGLGIHGEPGLSETNVPTADGLAELFVSQLLEELPAGIGSPHGQRVVAILNGLGAVKYEELFVVYRKVHSLLAAAGVSIVDSEVGEVCTSFDMAGVSLSLMWVNEDLEKLWAAPADTPAFQRGLVLPSQDGPEDVRLATNGDGAAAAQTQADDRNLSPVDDSATIGEAGDESKRAAATAQKIFAIIEKTMIGSANELGRIDAIAGDGDHGIGMERGARAASAAAHAARANHAGVGTLVGLAGDAWADRAGGTSGALWGLMLRTISARLGDAHAPTALDLAAAVSAARRAIMAAGGAVVGDKTMVDVLVPFDDTLAGAVASGASIADAWRRAAVAASDAADATKELVPQMGRARPHAERSLGTPDAGAVSLALIVTEIGHLLGDVRGATSGAGIDPDPDQSHTTEKVGAW